MDKSVVSLTRRQWQVAAYLAMGFESGMIADALGVSKRTVDFHINAIYARLQSPGCVAENRTQLYHLLGLWNCDYAELGRIARTGEVSR